MPYRSFKFAVGDVVKHTYNLPVSETGPGPGPYIVLNRRYFRTRHHTEEQPFYKVSKTEENHWYGEEYFMENRKLTNEEREEQRQMNLQT